MNIDSPLFKNGQSLRQVRAEFPILGQSLHLQGSSIPVPLVYLDNAATSQKPAAVIQRESAFYNTTNANVHRALHTLGEKATEEYENARKTVQGFINAEHASEVIFTRNTTESINLVAASYGGSHVKAGDEIILTEMEHHSNIIPWQLLKEKTGCVLKFIPFTNEGTLDLDVFKSLITEKTVLIGVIHVSNVFGTENDISEIITEAHKSDIPVLIDGAQSIPHMPIDVQKLDCDFFTFSGHKMFGPMGIGVLYGKEQLLETMPPYMGGGEMIRSVRLSGSTWNDLPWKFEAGTPNVPGALSIEEAIFYIQSLGIDEIQAYESFLTDYTLNRFSELDEVILYGPKTKRTGVFSFTYPGIHPHDMSQFLDRYGIAIRAGHHCAQPVMRKLKVPSTSRASIAFYNTTEEVDYLIEKIKAAGEYFNHGLR